MAAVSITGRIREMEQWGLWLKRRRPKVRIEAISRLQIEQYIGGRGVCRSKWTQYCVVSHLRQIGHFLVGEQLWQENPLRWIKGPRVNGRMKLPRGVSKGDMLKMWEEAAKINPPYSRRLWICVLSILYGTGIRRGQLIRLRLQDWDRERGLLRVSASKGGRAYALPVPMLTARCIETYLPWRQNILLKEGVEREELLVSLHAKPLRGNKINDTLKRLARKAGIGHVTPHQFRHTCASHLLEAGRSLAEVQRILGHKYLSSTYRYTDVTDPAKADAIAKHPINRILGDQKEGA